jgi:transposase-like protein
MNKQKNTYIPVCPRCGQTDDVWKEGDAWYCDECNFTFTEDTESTESED